jgi:hypothetical protein
MTFTSTIAKHKNISGDKRVNHGTFTQGGGDTGGKIWTGLRTVQFCSVQHTGNSAVSNSPSTVQNFPCDDGIDIVTTAGACGIWLALGTGDHSV